MNNLKSKIDEKEQVIENEAEARKNDKRESEKQLSRLQNEIEQKNEQIENMAASSNTMKEIHTRLKQQMQTLEQKVITLETDFLNQTEEKEGLKRLIVKFKDPNNSGMLN
jgi:chromosome segregation ATPase